MPIEREFKFVLHNKEGLESEVAALSAEKGLPSYAVQQAYLSKGGRVRSKNYLERESVASKAPEYWFTYKHDLLDRPGVLEIECQISKADFDLAWQDGDHRITKTRYIISDEPGRKWEVDFFYQEGQVYLVLAECEVDDSFNGVLQPHELIQSNLRYAVAELDKRFSNRKLCNPKKVARLLKEIV